MSSQLFFREKAGLRVYNRKSQGAEAGQEARIQKSIRNKT